MPEFDLPIMLNFHNHKESGDFITSLEQATEQVIWEQRSLEAGGVVVTILNIINPEDRLEEEDEE